MYPLIRKFLFQLDPERSHYFALQGLQLAYSLGCSRFLAKKIIKPCKVMGLSFPNPIGLAAGLDKNAEYINALASLGFGFIEVGTVTPKPQEGNPTPRLFRLVKEEAIINRLGFNNKGVEYIVNQLKKTRYQGILGINIGKNRDTPIENALDDYLFCFRHLCKFASYVTVNVSSPNTEGLRNLQGSAYLTHLLAELKKEQKSFELTQKKYVPLVVKIAPDLSEKELQDIANIFLEQQIDGVIATNTTTQRDGVENSPFAKERGGLSGKPLCERNTQIIRKLALLLQNKIPIIASGGITDARSAQEKLQAGASLLQVYTGFIYTGPKIIERLGQ
jgi:dihydroorotate dehydrogenase